MLSTRTQEQENDCKNGSTVTIKNLLSNEVHSPKEINLVSEVNHPIESKEAAPPRDMGIWAEASKHPSSIVEIHEKFHKIILPFSSYLPNNPDKILALDLDETLLNYEVSKKNSTHVLINKDRIVQIISCAVKHNIMVVCITSRKFETPEEEESFLSVRKVLNEFGIDHFSFIFFTNAQSKVYALNHLLDVYYAGDANKKHNICLVDDNDTVLTDCMSAGYLVVKAEKNDLNFTYLKLTQHFLDETQELLEYPLFGPS